MSIARLPRAPTPYWSAIPPETYRLRRLRSAQPISQALIERGFKVYGVDASPTIVAAFRARFPSVPVECAAVEDSDFFARTFDGVVAWGLFFLLDVEIQRRLIKKVAGVLQRGGRLLFTAPNESGSWPDVMTGRSQFSLGYEENRKALRPKACCWLEYTVMKAKTTTTSRKRLKYCCSVGSGRITGKPDKGSRISGMRAIGRTDGTTALSVFACGYKMG